MKQFCTQTWANMSNWSGETLQFVWFLDSVENLDAATLFRAVWNAEPDNLQKNRVPNHAAPFLSLASSEVDGAVRRVQVQPGRVDLWYAIAPGAEGVFQNCFNFDAQLTMLYEQVQKISFDSHRVYRISLIGAQVLPVSDYNDSVREIYGALGFDLNIPRVSDLTFQVNSRVDFGESVVNRLLHLSTVSVQDFQFDLERPIAPYPSTRVELASRRQFDFNTVPDGQFISLERQHELFKLISEEMMRVAHDGTLNSFRSADLFG